jgi:hypothetical protein
MLTVPLALQMGDGGALKIKFRAQCPACQWAGTSALASNEPGSAPGQVLSAQAGGQGSRGPQAGADAGRQWRSEPGGGGLLPAAILAPASAAGAGGGRM